MISSDSEQREVFLNKTYKNRKGPAQDQGVFPPWMCQAEHTLYFPFFEISSCHTNDLYKQQVLK